MSENTNRPEDNPDKDEKIAKATEMTERESQDDTEILAHSEEGVTAEDTEIPTLQNIKVTKGTGKVLLNRRTFTAVAVVTALFGSFFGGTLTQREEDKLLIPTFAAVDRAFGENADDESLRSCNSRKTKELLVEAKANGEKSVDYDKLMDYLNDPQKKDRRWDSGILSRGTIPFQIFAECRFTTMTGHMAIGDLDADGLPELAYVKNDTKTFNIFWNQGLGRFKPEVMTALTMTVTNPMTFVDYDGDRDLDIVTMDPESGYISTLVNLGGRKFEQNRIVTGPDKMDNIGGDANWTMNIADLNKDGLSDLLVVNRTIGYQVELALLEGKQIRPLRVFYNTGDSKNPWLEQTLKAFPEIDGVAIGTKPSATGTQTTTNTSGSYAFAVADFNNDSWPDIYVASDARVPRFFIAKPGGEVFEDKTQESGLLDNAPNTMGAAAIDYDDDGWLDIIASDTDRKLGECYGNRACGGNGGHKLYRNNHDGTFTDIGLKVGIADAGWGFGFTLTDLNMDGYGDFTVATGDLPRSRLEETWLTTFDKPYLLLRDGDRWVDGSVDMLRKLRSPAALPIVASADFDGDLRPDLVFASFEVKAPYLLLNRTKGNAATISIRGKGRGGSPTGGEGALVRVEIKGRPAQTYSMANMMSNYMVSTSQTPIPLGLGPEGEAKVTVTFPSGQVVSGKIKAGGAFLFAEK